METKFSKATDSEHEVKLESSLISASWRGGSAIAGAKAGLEVLTTFVGLGADIKITCKTDTGKNVGKVSGAIKNNKYVGEVDISTDLKTGDLIYFEADLPGNSLKGESSCIPVYNIIVDNIKWSAKEARRGDKLTLTANTKGAPDKMDAKITIFEYDNDGAHDKIIELPGEIKNEKLEVKWEYEYHEDVDEIPTEEEMSRYGKKYNPPEYFYTITIGGAVFGKKQESGLLLFKDYIDIVLKNQNGNPVPEEDYVVYLPDGTERKGKLDEEGKAVEKDIPPGDCRIEFPNV
jgi:hypothetical protein